jgi:hypothetical protein
MEKVLLSITKKKCKNKDIKTKLNCTLKKKDLKLVVEDLSLLFQTRPDIWSKVSKNMVKRK